MEVLINNSETFEDVHERFAGKIRQWARQYVPGYTYEEVVVEITSILWKAWRTFDEDKGTGRGGSFDGYFHMLWTHRKADIIEESFRRQRLDIDTIGGADELAMLADTYGLTTDEDRIPACPVGDPTACKVWRMLAQGDYGTEIREQLRLSKKAFDEIMRIFRTDPIVRRALGPAF